MAAVKYKELEENGQLTVKEIHKVVVHTFTMGDVEDPDLFAAEPMCKWQESEQGKFVMENAVDQPEWHRHLDHTIYGYKYAITAELEAKKLSEFYLRWGKDGSGKIR
jgi:hypothetical protein